MTLPASVKVGAWTYSIEEWPPNEGRSQEKFGETVHSLRRISLDTNYDHQRTAATLLHEILHIVHHEWNVKPGDPEERLIETLESGLAAVWRDSPEVMAWIHKGLAP